MYFTKWLQTSWKSDVGVQINMKERKIMTRLKDAKHKSDVWQMFNDVKKKFALNDG